MQYILYMNFKKFMSENDFSLVGDLSSSFSNEDGNFKFSDIQSKYFTKSYKKNINNNNGKIQKIFRKKRK